MSHNQATNRDINIKGSVFVKKKKGTTVLKVDDNAGAWGFSKGTSRALFSSINFYFPEVVLLER